MVLLPTCFSSLLGVSCAEVVENKQRHRVNRGVEENKKGNMNEERNPVGKRIGDSLHFEYRNKTVEKIWQERLSMWKKHLSRIKSFRKGMREITWAVLEEQYKWVKMANIFF